MSSWRVIYPQLTGGVIQGCNKGGWVGFVQGPPVSMKRICKTWRVPTKGLLFCADPIEFVMFSTCSSEVGTGSIRRCTAVLQNKKLLISQFIFVTSCKNMSYRHRTHSRGPPAHQRGPIYSFIIYMIYFGSGQRQISPVLRDFWSTFGVRFLDIVCGAQMMWRNIYSQKLNDTVSYLTHKSHCVSDANTQLNLFQTPK